MRPLSDDVTPEVHRRVTRSMTQRKLLKPTLTSTTQRSKPKTHVSVPVAVSARRVPPISSQRFGLIQESVATNLYELLVAAVLWNRTRGTQARPIFVAFLSRYPTPQKLAEASEEDLAELIRPLGLYHTRARRFLAFAGAWIQSPPVTCRRYRKLHYPTKGAGLEIGKDEVLDEHDEREAWEVAHLPSIGPYALDSFRIFHRDMMRGLATDWNGRGAKPGFEPEWKRVVPTDKELKAYLQWMWLKEGWIWSPTTAVRTRASKGRMAVECGRVRSVSPGGQPS